MSSIEEAVATTPPNDEEAVEVSQPEEEEATPKVYDDSADTKPKLNHKNILNVVAYILNITLVYGVGNAGWLDTPNNGELSDKYQTAVTPNSQAFIIWAVIFLAQGLFAVLQLLPKFRAHAMVQDALGYWYSSVTATQIGWTFAFAYEVIPLSLTFMLLIWISLMTILYRQYYTKSDNSLWEFWVLRFPFAVHAGWITAASALNVNVQVVAMNQPADIQLAVAIVSLAVLHAISVHVTFYITRPNFTISSVLSWALGWIYVELGEPNEKITSTFAPETISGVMYAAIAVCFIILFQMVVRLALLVRPSFNPYKKVEEEQQTVESGDEENVKVY